MCELRSDPFVAITGRRTSFAAATSWRAESIVLYSGCDFAETPLSAAARGEASARGCSLREEACVGVGGRAGWLVACGGPDNGASRWDGAPFSRAATSGAT